jgi:hypothetical protein
MLEKDKSLRYVAMPAQIDVKPTADPALLRQQARQLHAVADDLDSGMSVSIFGGAPTRLTWRGQSANQFEQDVRAYHGKLIAQASELRSIAAAMLQGATDIEKYRASIARLRSELSHPATAG